ncbi:MAG: helix-turn-helix domain-containing protein [Clostridia bacterium]|nr:helix-turn-helix domain-containing protein [Clostridia bacterium]
MFKENLFRAALCEVGISIPELAKKLSISKTTLYRKMNGESDFYRNEIQIVAEIIGKEKVDSIFFAR